MTKPPAKKEDAKAPQNVNFGVIEGEKQLEALELEIIKMKPKVEVTLAGKTQSAFGKIISWTPKDFNFVVKFSEKPSAFNSLMDLRDETEYKVFFKAHLLSGPVVFKTKPVRSIDDMSFEFRIPDELYRQQRRGSLRVPLSAGAGWLACKRGTYEIADLSVGGARLRLVKTGRLAAGTKLEEPILQMGDLEITSPAFEVEITSSTDASMGCKFIGLTDAERNQIKTYLVEALKIYYQGVTASND